MPPRPTMGIPRTPEGRVRAPGSSADLVACLLSSLLPPCGPYGIPVAWGGATDARESSGNCQLDASPFRTGNLPQMGEDEVRIARLRSGNVSQRGVRRWRCTGLRADHPGRRDHYDRHHSLRTPRPHCGVTGGRAAGGGPGGEPSHTTKRCLRANRAPQRVASERDRASRTLSIGSGPPVTRFQFYPSWPLFLRLVPRLSGTRQAARLVVSPCRPQPPLRSDHRSRRCWRGRQDRRRSLLSPRRTSLVQHAVSPEAKSMASASITPSGLWPPESVAAADTPRDKAGPAAAHRFELPPGPRRGRGQRRPVEEAT